MGGLMGTLSALWPFSKGGGGGIAPAQEEEETIIYEEPDSPTGYVNKYNEPVDPQGRRVNASLQPVEQYPGQLRGVPATPMVQAGPEVDDSEIVYSAGIAEKLKHYYIRTFSLLGGLTIWVVLSLGNFQLFNNFSGFTWSAGSISALVGGFVLEGVGLSLLFVAADHYRKKNWGGFIGAGLGFLFFALCSTYTQYELLNVEMARGELVIPAQALVGQIISDPRGMLLLRALMYNVGEVFLVFLVTKYEPDANATAREKIKLAQSRVQLKQAEHVIHLLNASNDIATGVLQGQAKNLMAHTQAILHGGIMTQEPKVIVQQVPHLMMLEQQYRQMQGQIPANMATGVIPDAQPVYMQVPASAQRPVTAEYYALPEQPIVQHPPAPVAQTPAPAQSKEKAQRLDPVSVATFSPAPGIKEAPVPLTFAPPKPLEAKTDEAGAGEGDEEVTPTSVMSQEDRMQLAVQTLLANPATSAVELQAILKLRKTQSAVFFKVKAEDMIARHRKDTGEQEQVTPPQEQGGAKSPRPFLAGATTRAK